MDTDEDTEDAGTLSSPAVRARPQRRPRTFYLATPTTRALEAAWRSAFPKLREDVGKLDFMEEVVLVGLDHMEEVTGRLKPRQGGLAVEPLE